MSGVGEVPPSVLLQVGNGQYGQQDVGGIAPPRFECGIDR
jgi:hypothetical protein